MMFCDVMRENKKSLLFPAPDTCSDLVTTMFDDLYNNVQMLTNSIIVKCKVILATLQSIIIKWQH